MIRGGLVFLGALHFSFDLCDFLCGRHWKVENSRINIIKISILFAYFTAKSLQKTARRLHLCFQSLSFLPLLFAASCFLGFHGLTLFLLSLARAFVCLEFILSDFSTIKYLWWILVELGFIVFTCFFLAMLKYVFICLFELVSLITIVGFYLFGCSRFFLFFTTHNIVDWFYYPRKGVNLITDGKLKPFLDLPPKFFDLLFILPFNLTLSLRKIAIMPSATVEQR